MKLHRTGMIPAHMCLLLVTACVSAPQASDEAAPRGALTTENASSEAVQEKFRKPVVTVFDETPLSVNDNEGCRNGYFRWLAWDQLQEEQDLLLKTQSSFQIGNQKVALQWSGDPVRGKVNRVPGRIFEEDLAVQGYAYPYQGLIFHGVPIKFESQLEIAFQQSPIDRNYVLTIGQLFRYTDQALTEIVISSPGVSLKDSFDLVQSAAAYRSRDFDAPLRVQWEGLNMRILQDGPTGNNSGFLFLRPKKGVKIAKLKFEIRSDRWAEAHPDQVEIGLAQLFCGERACQQASQVVFYDPGQVISGRELFSKDALLALGEHNQQNSTQFTSIGPGGRLELKLDGISVNRDGPELDIYLRKGRCVGAENIQVFAREKSQSPWQRLDRLRIQCDKVSVDLYQLPLIREIQIRNVSDSTRHARVIDVDAVTCRK